MPATVRWAFEWPACTDVTPHARDHLPCRVLLNLSATHLKLGEPQPALQAAAAALALDPQSAKVPLTPTVAVQTLLSCIGIHAAAPNSLTR
jgi:hypothetical protein